MSTATKGRAAEHEARATAETHGYYVLRSAGSKGAADLVAFREGHAPLLIQVKAGKSAFGPVDRAKLVHLAGIAHGIPLLAERKNVNGSVVWSWCRVAGAYGEWRRPWVWPPLPEETP